MPVAVLVLTCDVTVAKQYSNVRSPSQHELGTANGLQLVLGGARDIYALKIVWSVSPANTGNSALLSSLNVQTDYTMYTKVVSGVAVNRSSHIWLCTTLCTLCVAPRWRASCKQSSMRVPKRAMNGFFVRLMNVLPSTYPKKI
eukprot:525773-Pleurochrysis_carterae.AAC.7